MKAKLIVLLSAAAIAILSSGTFLGMLLEKQIVAPNLEKAQVVARTISSKLVPSIVAFGKVKDITGRNITLSYNKEYLVVKIKDDAKVYSLGNIGTKNSQQEVRFSDVKKDDYINLSLKIDQDGEVQGTRILILSMIQK